MKKQEDHESHFNKNHLMLYNYITGFYKYLFWKHFLQSCHKLKVCDCIDPLFSHLTELTTKKIYLFILIFKIFSCFSCQFSFNSKLKNQTSKTQVGFTLNNKLCLCTFLADHKTHIIVTIYTTYPQVTTIADGNLQMLTANVIGCAS